MDALFVVRLAPYLHDMTMNDQPNSILKTATGMIDKTVELFGFPIRRASCDQLVGDCIAYLKARRDGDASLKTLRVFAVNPEKVVRSRHDPELDKTLRQSEILIPDGIGISLGAWAIKGFFLPRIAGADLMPALVRGASYAGLSIYLYGGKPSVNAKAAEALLSRYPGLNIAGRANGYGQGMSPGEVVADIKAKKPDMLFIALGSPMQEKWVEEHIDTLGVGLIQGVGGTFDVIAGEVRRAPLAFRMTGTEWLYRLGSQPSRWRRQLALIDFMTMVIHERGMRSATFSEPISRSQSTGF